MNSTDEEKRLQEVLQKFKDRVQDPLRLKELFSILKLVFYDGLEKKEATDLKFGDYRLGDKADQISLTPGGNPIQMSDEVKSALLEYIEALEAAGSSMTPDSSLFPGYSGQSGRKNLDRDLKSLNIAPINFDRLRRAGVVHYHSILKQKGFEDSEAIKEAASKFRLTQRTVKDIFGGKTQPPGQRPPEQQSRDERMMNLIEQQENLNSYDILISGKVPELVEKYFKEVDEDGKLSCKN
jgi:hypothetical protein